MPPTRPVLGARTRTSSPRPTSHTVNNIVNSISQKLTSSINIEQVSPPPSRRPSFSMEAILHSNKKEKKRDDSKERDSKKDKRISFAGSKPSKTKDKHNTASPLQAALKPVKLDVFAESPPLVFYGNINNSTGALFSGRLKLIVQDPTGSVKLNDFTMVLRATINTSKPIGKECQQCANKHEELKNWKLISEPTSYASNQDHQFPFSYLFPGHLPASTHSQLGSLSYSFVAQATTDNGEKIEFVHPVKISRAVPPGPEKASIRIFPPTHLTGRVQLPPVVHPIGTFPVKMTLSGVVEKRAESATRWRLRKMMWRIEETCKVVSTPCEKHAHKVSDGKAIQHTDTVLLNHADVKEGWKTDFDTIGGEILLEFEASLTSTGKHKPTCDMASSAGLEMKHSLIIELIVAEEFVPLKNTALITPTGAARVLRMQFNLPVTERAGMGIAWDEEMPPMYEDVPPSPPGYGGSGRKDSDEQSGAVAIIEDYVGPTIVPHDLERLPTMTEDGLPHYREVEYEDLNAGLPMRSRRHTNNSGEAESSGTRQRLAGMRLEDLEAEAAGDAHRRRQLEETDHEAVVEDDYGEGSAGNAAQGQS